MRTRTYFKRNIATGEITEHVFNDCHFREAGALVTPFVGMHVSAALQLVNKWNKASNKHKRFMYYVG